MAALAFSADSQTLHTGGGDGVVITWEVASGRILRRHYVGGAITSLDNNPSNGSLAVAHGKKLTVLDSGNKTSWQWNHPTLGLRFLSAGKLLAAHAVDGRTLIFNSATGEVDQSLGGATSTDQFDYGFSPGGYSPPAYSTSLNLMATQMRGTVAQLYNPETAELRREMHLARQPPGLARDFSSTGPVALQPRGNLMALCEVNQHSSLFGSQAQIWEVTQPRLVQFLPPSLAPINAMAFSPRGDKLALVEGSWYRNNGAVKLWDVASRKMLTSRVGKPRRAVAFSPDGRWLAAGGGPEGDALGQPGDTLLLRGEDGALFRVLTGGKPGPALVTAPPASRVVPEPQVQAQPPMAVEPQPSPTLEVVSGHATPAQAVAATADGKWVATANTESIILWNRETGEQLQTLAGGASWLKFLADGRLASYLDGILTFWHPGAWTATRVALPSRSDYFGSQILSGDGKWLLQSSGGYSSMGILLVNTSNGEAHKTLSWPEGRAPGASQRNELATLDMSADAGMAVSGHKDGTLRIWQPMEGKLLRTISGEKNGIWQVLLSPDKTAVIAIPSVSGAAVKVWSTATGKPLKDLPLETYYSRKASFAPGTNVITTESGAWDFPSGVRIATWRSGGGPFYDAARNQVLLPEGAGWSSQEVSSGRSLSNAAQPPADIYGEPLFTPDGKRLVFGRLVWDLESASLLTRLDIVGYIQDTTFSANGKELVMALQRRDGDETVGELWRWDSREFRLQNTREITDLSELAPGAQYAATGQRYRKQIVSLANGKKHGPYVAERYTSGAFAFSDDGTTFATTTSEKSELRAVANGKLMVALQPGSKGQDYQREFGQISISAGRGYVAALGHWPGAQVWSGATGNVLHQLGSADSARLAFAPDSKTLWAVGRTIRRFDTLSGRLNLSIPRAAHALGFGPGGKQVAVAGPDGALELRRASDGRLQATLRVLPVTNGNGEAARMPDWVIFTPDGYYTCSRNASSRLRWRLGQSVLPLAHLAEKYHRPDLVKLALQGKL